MCKTLKKCFDEKLTFQKLLEAHERAREGKRGKKEVILFEMDLETNLIKMMDEIKKGTYQFGQYRTFKVFEPKERIIKSLPYQDRIVHQWYVEEFIKPYFFKRFIKDTYACLEGRGTHKAVENVQRQMRRMKKEYSRYYVLKCDIRKYFYSIDKNILLSILKRKIRDQKILYFSKKILDDGEPIGIPIGNFTSQYFANIYLNELDHYIKENLQVKYYTRYMDDFILLVSSKKEAKELKDKISQFLKEHLSLELNSKSRFFCNTQGIDFCGYRIYETHILLRKRFKRKIKKKIQLWVKLKKEKKFLYKKFQLSYHSFQGHAKHCNSYRFMQKIKYQIENDLLKE